MRHRDRQFPAHQMVNAQNEQLEKADIVKKQRDVPRCRCPNHSDSWLFQFGVSIVDDRDSVASFLVLRFLVTTVIQQNLVYLANLPHPTHVKLVWPSLLSCNLRMNSDQMLVPLLTEWLFDYMMTTLAGSKEVLVGRVDERNCNSVIYSQLTRNCCRTPSSKR